jgi:hypothetical protein
VPSEHQPDPPDVEAEADQEQEGVLLADLKPFTAADFHLEDAPPARLSLHQMMAKVGPMLLFCCTAVLRMPSGSFVP